jgi:hypothetical protein
MKYDSQRRNKFIAYAIMEFLLQDWPFCATLTIGESRRTFYVLGGT